VKKPRAGSWQGYWTTKIGWAEKGAILVRGYRAEELIRALSFAEAAYLVIRGELPTRAQAQALDAVLRSGLDQAFISSAIPAARFAASAAPEAPAAAIAAGVIAFGSVTGSPRECAEMLAAAHHERSEHRLSLPEAARRTVEACARDKRRIPGLGHPVHKKREPRAAALREIALELGVWGERARLFDAVALEASRRWKRPLPQNLAGVIAAVLLEIGFAPLEMVGLGILSYLPALIAHTTEEIREGHPLRIIPPALGARYAGPAERPLPARYATRRARRKP
jgi:citrate synthase